LTDLTTKLSILIVIVDIDGKRS